MIYATDDLFEILSGVTAPPKGTECTSIFNFRRHCLNFETNFSGPFLNFLNLMNHNNHDIPVPIPTFGTSAASHELHAFIELLPTLP